ASVVAGVLGSPFSSKKGEDIVQAQDINRLPNRPFDYKSFVNRAYRVRVEAARLQQSIPIPPHPTKRG
ncbi:MAG: twin-arginine translocation pathway signal protein, partial [Nostoc sp.]